MFGIAIYGFAWPDKDTANALITFLAVLAGGIISYLASWYFYFRAQQDSAFLRPIPRGLKGFEDRICELMRKSGISVQLLLVTPLLHSFRYEWIPYTADAYHDHERDPKYWAMEFCKPFIDILAKAKDQGRELKVELAFLKEEKLAEVVKKVPKTETTINETQYKDSVEFFLDKVADTQKTPAEWKAKYVRRIPEVPFYLGLIDCDSPENKRPRNAWGVVAFISSTTLIEQSNMGRSADEIALTVMAYEFQHPEIMRFFASQFRQHFKSGTQEPENVTSCPNNS